MKYSNKYEITRETKEINSMDHISQERMICGNQKGKRRTHKEGLQIKKDSRKSKEIKPRSNVSLIEIPEERNHKVKLTQLIEGRYHQFRDSQVLNIFCTRQKINQKD